MWFRVHAYRIHFKCSVFLPKNRFTLVWWNSSQDLNKESSLLNCLEIHDEKFTKIIFVVSESSVVILSINKRPKKNTPASSKWPFKITQKIQVTKKPQTFKGHLFFSTQKGHWEEELGKNTLDIKFLPGCLLISSDPYLVEPPAVGWKALRLSLVVPCTAGPHGLRLPIKTSECQIGWCFSGCQNVFFWTAQINWRICWSIFFPWFQ